MDHNVVTKSEWYVYYSENGDQNRFVSINKDDAAVLYFATNLVSSYFNLYVDLLRIDESRIMSRIIDIDCFKSFLVDVLDEKVKGNIWLSVSYNAMKMIEKALAFAKRTVQSNMIACFTTRSLTSKIEGVSCKFDQKWWSREIKHPEQLPEGVLIKYPKQSDSCSPKIEVVLEGKYDEESDWVKIKTCELEPGSTVDITKETKKYVKTFKEFRFVRRIVDKTLVRSGISLFDPENDIEYKIEE